jgi:hypothetical protein
MREVLGADVRTDRRGNCETHLVQAGFVFETVDDSGDAMLGLDATGGQYEYTLRMAVGASLRICNYCYNYKNRNSCNPSFIGAALCSRCMICGVVCAARRALGHGTPLTHIPIVASSIPHACSNATSCRNISISSFSDRELFVFVLDWAAGDTPRAEYVAYHNLPLAVHGSGR